MCGFSNGLTLDSRSFSGEKLLKEILSLGQEIIENAEGGSIVSVIESKLNLKRLVMLLPEM